ncbi:hypothetical protein PLESTB_000005600 [Pleodorina starrii]|uniref:Phosphoribulokinase/uridine kinase domain-containing protein n=1 Tax=Pleodorina starrii TaxID=330485 RepID=A0A9W6B824_9CHLO|nr:hypothetical protein PLESTM_000841600 [Pleodorina starrii]GLC47598.1 hypothetical protein PLESTB_000005600 [Pleodorina starrii]GLC75606.1 hypothetical protein PLESTF_001664600 [Pleodorina starrii]
MLLTQRQRQVPGAGQRQAPGAVVAQRQAPRLSVRPLNSVRKRAVCKALEITGEAYEDIVDQLARRALDTHRHRHQHISGAGSAIDSSTSSTSSSSSSDSDSGTRPSCLPGCRSAAGCRVVVGIAGAPGSGKTTLAAAVAARINQLAGQEGREGQQGREGKAPFAAVVPMDGFHYYRRELDEMPDPQEAHARRGAPWTFDGVKFVEAVRRVRAAGGAAAAAAGSEEVGPSAGCADVRLPSFDHGLGDPVEGDIVVAAHTAVVLVEGNYLLLDQEPWRQLRELFDESWFVSCPRDVITQRLFERQTGIGLTPEVSRQRIATNDLPNAQLVAECGGAGAADVVVPGWVAPREGGR